MIETRDVLNNQEHESGTLVLHIALIVPNIDREKEKT